MEGGGNQVSRAELMASGINNNASHVPSTMPEQFWSLFRPEDMLDIGDEVTVPASPFQNITDHSYVCSATRFGDCDPGLHEFQDLFDFTSDFDLGGTGVQEQEDRPGIDAEIDGLRQWNSMMELARGDESLDNDNESSSEEEGTDRSQEMDYWDQRKRKRGHHTGPFPHTFIPVPGDRRIRFCLGLQTIVTKVRALMSRTGSTAEFRAEFEGHVFTLDNIDKMMKFSNRSQKSKPKKVPETVSSQVQPPTDASADDDHRYAAPISTQSKSPSSVQDTQYSQSTAEEKRTQRKSVQKSYIRTRYARERWLRKCATTIYTKMQRLVNRTGAKMMLRIQYEGLTVTPLNYKDLDHLLGKSRSSAKRFNTHIMVHPHENIERSTTQNMTCNSSQSPSESSGGSLLKVSCKPSSSRLLHAELVKTPLTSPSKLLQTIVESDHDYDNLQSSSLRSSPRMLDRLECPSPLSLLSAVQEVEDNSDLRNFDFHHEKETRQQSSLSSSSSSLLSPTAESRAVSTANASTSTEPLCQVCNKSSSASGTSEQQWIRCANPLCYYLVHPSCIGFFVTSPHSLQFLPLYFCPTHRGPI